jgi:hypothetical protein
MMFVDRISVAYFSVSAAINLQRARLRTSGAESPNRGLMLKFAYRFVISLRIIELPLKKRGLLLPNGL